MDELKVALQAIVFGLLANELFVWQPWCIRWIVWLAAWLDADSPDEVDGIYAEHMDGISRVPGYLARLAAALGLLCKVALVRRVRGCMMAIVCVVTVRVGLLCAAVRRVACQSRAGGQALSTRPTWSSLMPWHTIQLKVAAVMIDSGAEVTETRRIVAHESGLQELMLYFAIRPPNDDTGSPGLDELSVEVLAGGVLLQLERDGRSSVAMGLLLPRPLAAGEEHDFTTRMTVTKPFAPHYVFTSMYPCERFSLAFRFSVDRIPTSVWAIERAHRHELPELRTDGPPLVPDSTGVVCAEFDNLQPGLMSGIAWDPAPSPSSSMSRH